MLFFSTAKVQIIALSAKFLGYFARKCDEWHHSSMLLVFRGGLLLGRLEALLFIFLRQLRMHCRSASFDGCDNLEAGIAADFTHGTDSTT